MSIYPLSLNIKKEKRTVFVRLWAWRLHNKRTLCGSNLGSIRQVAPVLSGVNKALIIPWT